jgi:dolichol-phosphate mannosyltransferase
MTNPKLSVVSPVFCAASIVGELVARVTESAAKVTDNLEIILVDDGSRDDSWARIVEATEKNPRVRGIRLSRNFGQQCAITAGVANACGDLIVVMDCDLQDDPRYIPALVERAAEGFDVVLTSRIERNHPWLRNVFAELFYKVFNALTDRQPADRTIGGYSLITRKVADAYLRIGDVHRHYLGVLGWLGFKQAVIRVEHGRRHSGRSSYTFLRLMRHAMDGITSQSTKLLRVSIAIGFAYVAAAVLGVIYLVVSYYVHGFRGGWASTMVLLLGSTGIILTAIGILGIYLGNVFEQVRPRPLYLVGDSRNFPAPPK